MCRASKSPDLAGDLPIFDVIMKISRSPDLELNLPIYYKFGEFCLKPFANFIFNSLVLIGQHRGDVFYSTLGVMELLHVFHNSCKRDCDCKNTTR